MPATLVPVRRRAAALLAIALAAAACDAGAGPRPTTATTVAPTSTAATTTTAVTLPPATTTTAAPGERPRGGEVIVGALDVPVTLNRYAPGGEGGMALVLGQAYWAGVAKVDGVTLELIPDVVEVLPSVANGGLILNADATETVEYRIDPRAVWADGTPISGADFEFTYRQILDPANAADTSGYDEIIPESIEVGLKSFRFTMARPSLLVESLFSVLLPAHQVSGTDLVADWTDAPWVSGGPFEFDSWATGPDTDPYPTVTLTRNPNYWKVDESTGQTLPHLDRVLVRFFPDPETMISAFQERRIDLMSPGWDPVLLAELGAAEGAAVAVVGNGQWEHLSFQFGEGRLARNPKSYNQYLTFRRAVAHAIDRERLVQELFAGWGRPMHSYLEAFTPAWSGAAWEQYDYDPELSRSLIADLCDDAGIDCAANPPAVVFTAQSADLRITISEILEPMFADVGIGFSAQLDPALVFFGSTLDFGRYDLGSYSWTGDPGLAALVRMHGAWDPKSRPPIGLAFSRWGSAAVSGESDAGYNQGPSSVIDEFTTRYEVLFSLMKTTADPDELRGYFAEAEQILAGQLVFLPLFENPDAALVWADEVGGYRHSAAPGGDLWNVGEWYRADG